MDAGVFGPPSGVNARDWDKWEMGWCSPCIGNDHAECYSNGNGERCACTECEIDRQREMDEQEYLSDVQGLAGESGDPLSRA